MGIAYLAGVTRALEEVGGFCPDDADLIVGTSAGSMVGSMLRSGLSTEDLWLLSLGEHPEIDTEDLEEQPWSATWNGPMDAVRRVVGSAYVLQRSMLRIPMPHVPVPLQRLFPGGFYSVSGTDDVIAEFLPAEWPDKLLWLVAVDVRSGRRVVLGRRNPVRTDLHTAVRASCAIPAFFQPIRVGRRILVDGGVHSTTNLDLTSKIKPDVVVAAVPMAFDPSSPPGGVDRVLRGFAQRTLGREVAQLRDRGSRVLLIRPNEDDIATMGANMMRRSGNETVTRVAFDSAARQLQTPRGLDVMAQLREMVSA